MNTVRATTKRNTKAARKPALKRTEAYEQLLLDIICRVLPPGTVLDEASLQRRYKTGLASIREALFRLSIERLVHRWPRVGTRVTDLSVFELQQVFEARMVVEVNCAGIAAQMATPDDLKTIREALAGWRGAIDRRDFRELVRLDQQFHRGVAEATHNQVLIPIVHMLHTSALRYWHFTLPRRSRDAAIAGMERHQGVLKAIEEHNRPEAERAMRELLGLFSEAKEILGAAPHPVSS